MKALVACEESQAITIELRMWGVEAYSCDIQECSGGHPEWHIKGDVLPLLNESWDLIIAHPPCTYLSNAGARWLYSGGKLNKDRYNMGLDGKEFFMKFYFSNCDHVAIENPIPSRVYDLPQYTQVIQPYEFGDPWSKKTCLWLKGLPLLHSTELVIDYLPFCSSGSYSNSHDPKYKGASRKGGSAKSRSKTFPGIARAMAAQWVSYLRETYGIE